MKKQKESTISDYKGPYPEIDGAEEELMEISKARFHEFYNDNPYGKASKRLYNEFNGIIINGFASIYIIAKRLVDYAKSEGYQIGSRGSAGSSFVAYLLGITDINPLEYDIPFEVFAGCRKNDVSGADYTKVPDFDFNLCNDGREAVIKYFEEMPDAHKVIKIDILGHKSQTKLNKLEEATGIDVKSIQFDDEKTLDLLINTDAFGVPEFGMEFARKVIKAAQPVDFKDFVKISGLCHGTDVWSDNADKLIESGVATLQDVISTRDEVMVYLMEKGFKRENAFTIMEDLRKGKGLSDDFIKMMREADIPDWYIESCKKIIYLFPKAHAVAYTMTAFRLAWFKAHYPDAFSNIISCD